MHPSSQNDLRGVEKDNYESANSHQKKYNMKIAGWKNVIWIAIAILVLGVFWYNQSETKGDESHEIVRVTVEDVRREIVSGVNNGLNDPNHPIRKIVENAHLTVDVKNAYVLKCEIDTLDGSANAGRNCDNISQIKLTIRLVWDGIFHFNGKTDFETVYSSTGELVSAGIVQTDALVNTEDPEFWFDVGYVIGELFFSE